MMYIIIVKAKLSAIEVGSSVGCLIFVMAKWKKESETEELSGCRVHYVAGYADIVGHQRMFMYQINGLMYGRFAVIKAVQPAVKVDAAMTHQSDMFFRDSAFAHKVEHFGGIHTLHTAVSMADYHDFFHTKFVDGYEERAHG